MSARVKLLTRIFLVVLIFTGPVAAADEQSAGEVRQRLEAVQAHIRAKRARFAEEQEKIGSLNTELARLETEIGDVARRLHETMQRLEAERAKLRTLQLRKRQQFEALARHRAALADQLRAAYMMGRQEKLKLLLNQQDPQIVGRMLVYYDYFNR
ncbi:MAG: peptidase M23, partial [Pseudomonadota bacterium]|nr:peptidase M23 [Pseudomonadota bacterium]